MSRATRRCRRRHSSALERAERLEREPRWHHASPCRARSLGAAAKPRAVVTDRRRANCTAKMSWTPTSSPREHRPVKCHFSASLGALAPPPLHVGALTRGRLIGPWLDEGHVDGRGYRVDKLDQKGNSASSGGGSQGAPSRCVGRTMPGLTAMQQSVTALGEERDAPEGNSARSTLHAVRSPPEPEAANTPSAAGPHAELGRLRRPVHFVATTSTRSRWRRPVRGRTPKAAAAHRRGAGRDGAPHCPRGVLAARSSTSRPLARLLAWCAGVRLRGCSLCARRRPCREHKWPITKGRSRRSS